MCSNAFAQSVDTTGSRDLAPAEVWAPYRSGVRPASDTLGAVIMAGKRTAIVDPAAQRADLSVNAARQIFAKVPGISVWENEGSGAQMGIAARGLSPNRSWEFNMRQNGHDICADAFGYPEAYFTPPMEAVDRIEVVRGAASLAFGPQFGGLVNFRLKKGALDTALAGETRQTLGAFGVFNSYNALGGTKGRWNYYGYMHHRGAEGWRRNSRYTTTTAYASVEYRASSKIRLGLQFTRMDLRTQQPGGLTDEQFEEDASSGSRSRNWLLVPWHTGATTAEYRPDGRTLVDVKVFGTLGERNSVGFLKAINEPDSVDRATGTFAPRQVDRDLYRNVGAEVRVRRGWTFIGREAQLAMGGRAYGAVTDRRQRGTGTRETDADISVIGDYARDLELTTSDLALFAENNFRVGRKLCLVPGFRYERIVSRVEGRINSTGTGDTDSGERERNILLMGMGVQWQLTEVIQLNMNYSQAYRPVLYSDLTPSATSDVVDPSLRDASGYNMDAGIRGQLGKWLQFDIGGFYMHYNDRIGTVLRDGANFRTNIGASVSKGVEAYSELDVLSLAGCRARGRSLSIFLAYTFTEAIYTEWNDPSIAEDPLKRISGKQVEYAPSTIVRTGVSWTHGKFGLSGLLNQVDGVFADASNTEAANAAATTGWIPGYRIIDANASWALTPRIQFIVGVNNLSDERYATRRAGGYPGPGLMPGMGRSWYLTLAATF